MTNVNKDREALLTQSRLKEVLEYNPSTGVFIWIKKTHPSVRIEIGQIAGSIRPDGYNQIMIDCYPRLAHRLAWLYVYGSFPEKEGKNFIDHIDGNRANNAIENLKEVSQSQNNRNAQIRCDNTSNVVGVYRHSNRRKSGKIIPYWVASWCSKDGKRKVVYFNIETYGEEQTYLLAVTERTKQIRLLELNQGITYSERHGTK